MVCCSFSQQPASRLEQEDVLVAVAVYPGGGESAGVVVVDIVEMVGESGRDKAVDVAHAVLAVPHESAERLGAAVISPAGDLAGLVDREGDRRVVAGQEA